MADRTDDVEVAVRRMSAEVDSAVMRARRIAAQAREDALAFRRELAGLAPAPAADKARPARRRPVVDEEFEDYSQEHIMKRR